MDMKKNNYYSGKIEFEDEYSNGKGNLLMKLRGHNDQPIYIRYDGQTTKIIICFCHYVNHLKEYIQRKLVIKPERQELSLNEVKLEKDGVDIASLGVKMIQ